MNPRVKDVFPRKDHTLLIVFKNGETKLYDCKPLLDFGVFQELNDLNYFLMAKVERGTVVWPHEQDICPDTLYLEGEEIEKESIAVH
jgi:hypothetical protein